MKAGKLASLILLAVLTMMAIAVAAVFAWIGSRGGFSGSAAILLQLLLFAALFASVLVPLGYAVDEAVTRLRQYVEGAARGESNQPFLSAATGLGLQAIAARVLARWLQPIAWTFSAAVDQFQQRERSLRNQMRDMEIRHRVSEAERCQSEAVLHALRDAVIVTDAFNEIVMVNSAAAELFGFDPADAIQRPINRVISDERVCRLINDAREAANLTDCRHVELELPAPGSRMSLQGPQSSKPVASDCDRVHAGGADRSAHPRQSANCLYNLTLACVENHKHEVGAVVTIFHDLTRERELSQMKTDFVSKASHELRTPLSSIRAYVEMLVDGEAADEASRREFYRVIQDETDRLGRLIDNLLNISRIEAGIVQIERDNVDIRQLIDRAVQTLQPQAREKDITLHTKFFAPGQQLSNRRTVRKPKSSEAATSKSDEPAADGVLCVEGDSDMLYQVVLNLTSNAVKYTPEGGRVTITADSDHLTRSVVVSVTDTGLGIPPDAVQRIFDKFYRVENYKRVAKGTGLGLSLCKHIVETVHHGQIGVDSKLGMGSKFWFTVPMRYAGAQAA